MAKLLLEENDILAEEVTQDDVEGTVKAAQIIIDKVPKDKDKNKWTETASKIIDAIPQDAYGEIANVLNSKGGNAPVDDETKQIVANEVDADMKTANGWKTVADILKYVDLADLSRENPKAAKTILITVLTVISIIEPTPIGEIITAVVAALPNEVLAKILQILGYLDPIHWVRQGVLKLAAKKEEKVTEENVNEDLQTNTENLKQWYTRVYPTDELGVELKDNITLDDVYNFLVAGKSGNGADFYNFIGVGDSLIRERIFEKLAEDHNVDYKVIYDLWLNS